eukprot:scaffold22211_cov38-Cyclotella_meneghiniana.AAC.2
MPTITNPSDEAPPPAASSSLASLRQSFAATFDPRRPAASASSTGTAAATSTGVAASVSAGVDAADSSTGGANDGELTFTSLGFSEGMLSFPGGGWRRLDDETFSCYRGRRICRRRPVVVFH